MSKRFYAFFVFFIMCLSVEAASKPVIKWAFDPWAPLHEKEKSGRTQGLIAEIVKAVLVDELGYEIEYHQLPWKRAQALVKTSSLDFMVTVPTNERLQYAHANTKPLHILHSVIYTNQDHPRMEEIKSIESLNDIVFKEFQVISSLGNGWVEDKLEPLGGKIFYAENYTNALKMLDRRRGDITIDVEPTTNLYLKQLGLEERIVNTAVSVDEWPLHFMVSKKSNHSNVLEDFDAAFEKLQGNGTIQKILDKYQF